MCLSPQCGFSSTHHGNNLTVEQEKAKLRLCIDTAREILRGSGEPRIGAAVAQTVDRIDQDAVRMAGALAPGAEMAQSMPAFLEVGHRLADVDRHRHPGIVEPQGLELRLTDLRPAADSGDLAEVGQLDDPGHGNQARQNYGRPAQRRLRLLS